MLKQAFKKVECKQSVTLNTGCAMSNKCYYVILLVFINIACAAHAMQERPRVKKRKVNRSSSFTLRKKAFFENVHNGTLRISDIQSYLNQGGSIDDTDGSPIGMKLIHLAAKAGRVDILAWLEKNSANIDAPTGFHTMRPIHFAAESGQIKVMQWLFDNGVDITIPDGSNHQRPIHFAAQGGSVEALQWLHDNGADIHVPDCVGYQPAHLAAKAGNVNALEWLLKNGADVNAPSIDRHSPIHLAAHAGQTEVLQWFHTHVSDAFEPEIARYALYTNHFNTIRWLHQNGADLRAPARSGAQPIHTAVCWCGVNLLEWLYHIGVDLNAVDKNGKQPVHCAASAETVDALIWLIENGADMNVLDNDDQSSVSWAYELSRFPTIVLLIAHGASIPPTLELPASFHEFITKESCTNEFCASDHADCSLPTITLQTKLSFKPKEVTLTTGDMLAMAAGLGKKKLIQCIIKHQADNICANDYTLALIGAATAGRIDIVNLLRKHMLENDSLAILLPRALSRALVRAAAQQKDGMAQHILDNYWDQLEPEIVVEALVRALGTGNMEIAEKLRNKIDDHDAMNDLLHDGLSRALIRAAAQGNTEFIEYLLAQGANPALAVEVLKEPLACFTPEEIVANSHLRSYQRNLDMLHFLTAITIIRLNATGENHIFPEIPTEERASLSSYLHLLPPELLNQILLFGIQSIIYDPYTGK